MKLAFKDIEIERKKIVESINSTQANLRNALDNKTSAALFHALKFNKIGCDPLNSSVQWNLVEQINQTFTYLVSLKAAEFLYSEFKDIEIIEFNLGTQGGFDLIAKDEYGCDIVVAEVFAAVKAHSNDKLRQDILKVMKSNAKYRYVFFTADGVADSNPYTQYHPKFDVSGVKVVSLNAKDLWK